MREYKNSAPVWCEVQLTSDSSEDDWKYWYGEKDNGTHPQTCGKTLFMIEKLERDPSLGHEHVSAVVVRTREIGISRRTSFREACGRGLEVGYQLLPKHAPSAIARQCRERGIALPHDNNERSVRMLAATEPVRVGSFFHAFQMRWGEGESVCLFEQWVPDPPGGFDWIDPKDLLLFRNL